MTKYHLVLLFSKDKNAGFTKFKKRKLFSLPTINDRKDFMRSMSIFDER